jgi:hypothetical protein
LELLAKNSVVAGAAWEKNEEWRTKNEA